MDCRRIQLSYENLILEDTLMEYIPDLEEVQEEDLTMAVASAPELAATLFNYFKI